MSLQKKLLAAHQALPDVLAKDQQRTEGARYRYLNEAGVLPVIRRAFLDAGLTLVVSTTGVVREAAAPRVDKKTGEVHQQQVVTVFLDAIITDPDSPDEPPLVIGLAGASICRDGKGLSSARTDALKGIRQALAIAADEPDNDHTPQHPPAEPLTHNQVAARARELGYTDEQRDLIISVDKAFQGAARLQDVATGDLQAAIEVLSDPAALEYARTHTAKAAA